MYTTETVEFNLEEEVDKAEKAREIISSSGSKDDQRISKAKIQKVPVFLRERPKFSDFYSDDQRTSKAKIQKVLVFLLERPKFCDFYSPNLLSIGPIHHRDDNLKLGEQYKLMWTAMYLTRVHGQQSGDWKIRDEYTKIKDKIVEVIKQRYSKEVIEEYGDNTYEALAWMLFVDGCSILEFMQKASYEKPEALNIKIDQLILMQQDLLLLENQIPFELLKLLCKDKEELSKSMANFLKLNHMVTESVIESQSVPICQQPICQKSTCQQPTHLLDYLRKILCDDLANTQHILLCDNQTDNQHKETSSVEQTTCQQPTPILDCLRKIFLCDDQTDNQHKETSSVEETTINIPEEQSTEKTKPKQNSKQKQNKLRKILCGKTSSDDQTDKWPRYRNIQELKAAGIKVTTMEKHLKAPNRCNIREIHFRPFIFFYGTLYLPRFVVDDSTGTIFSNLIAYEMCPDFKNDFTISSYVAFLDSLIDHPEDVKELRRDGILYNNLGSDQEVADLFNTITTDLVPDPKMYDKVKRKMEEHCNNRLKTWMAEFKYTHFQSPWSVLALLAAILLLGLAIVQTYYTINPK